MKKTCRVMTCEYVDLEVYLNVRLFYESAGYRVFRNRPARGADLLVVLRGSREASDHEYAGIIHIYDYVKEHKIDWKAHFPNAGKIFLISPTPPESSEGVTYIKGYLPVVPELWQASFEKKEGRPVHISHFKKIGKDRYQQDLVQLIKSGLVRAYGLRWDRVCVWTKPLSFWEADKILAASSICYGLMYPYQRGKTLSGRMWQAPLKGCFVISEALTNISNCPGVIEVDGFSAENPAAIDRCIEKCRALAADAAQYWKKAAQTLADELGLHTSPGSPSERSIIACKRELFLQHILHVSLRSVATMTGWRRIVFVLRRIARIDNLYRKKFYICSGGCERTKTYAQNIFHYFILNGFSYVNNAKKADMIVVDTCGYCQETEDNSLSLIKQCAACRKKGSKIIVIGCLPSINQGSLNNFKDLIAVSSNELEKIDKIIDAKTEFLSLPSVVEVMPMPSPAAPIQNSLLSKIRNIALRLAYRKDDKGLPVCIKYHINIGKGCLGSCTYCAIRQVWGRSRSRPLNEIINGLRSCVSKGADIIALETHDLGAYGLDINSTVVELFEKMFEVEGSYRLAMHDLNPQWVIRYYSDLERIFTKNAGRIFYININIQSGSDRILDLMKRPYHIEEAKKALFSLKRQLISTKIWCDIMVGFPGETEEDFEKTKRFVMELIGVGGEIWLTPYTNRPKTEASRMTDQIDKAEIARRLSELNKLCIGHILEWRSI